jgi:hypothetical protein
MAIDDQPLYSIVARNVRPESGMQGRLANSNMRGRSTMKVQGLRCIVLILTGLLFSIGYSVDVQAAAKPAYSLYIGKVADKPDEFVGIAVFGDDTTIYICDGQPDKGTVRIAEWFIGKVADKKIDITGKSGNQVVAALSRRSAEGQFKFKDGTVKKFTLTRGEATTALYRAEFAFGDKKYVGGWLVLADGSVRGAVLSVGDQVLVPSSISAYNALFGPKK